MSNALNLFFNENFDMRMSGVHIALPGVVKEYDMETRRAKIQPSIKRLMPDSTYMELPIVSDVPVLFFGTKKAGLHIPLEEGDEVLLICSERSLDEWKDVGSDGVEPVDRRRFSLTDMIAIPGLQATDFPNNPNVENISLHDDRAYNITIGENDEILLEFIADDRKAEITIGDHKIIIDDDGINITDKDKNNIALSNSGIKAAIASGSKIEMGSSGIVLQGSVGKVEVL